MRKDKKKHISLEHREYVKAKREGTLRIDQITEAILRRRTNPKIKWVEPTEDAILRGVIIEKLPFREYESKLNKVGPFLNKNKHISMFKQFLTVLKETR